MPRAPEEQQVLRRRIVLISTWFFHLIGLAVTLYASPLYWKQPYHTSALTGRAWVSELIHGHPDRIKTELGVSLDVYIFLLAELRLNCGLNHSRYIDIEEQLAIFLYTCRTGLTIRHVGERFQRSNETISK